MQVHTFRAESLQAALQQVRRVLGPDASILQTREKRQGRLGFFAKTVVEVEATLDVPVPSHFGNYPRANAVGSNSDDATPDNSDTSRQTLERPTANQPTTEMQETPEIQPTSVARQSNPTADTRPEAFSAAMLEVQADLLSSGMSDSMAAGLLREVVELVRGQGKGAALGQDGPNELADPWALRGRIGQRIAARIKVSGSIDLTEHKTRVVALVGPTGVGKTTTLAKIAAGFRFDLGCRIGLIALDTFRLGAVDQLLQYAELISAPLEVVSSPEQVTSALQRLSDCDLVLLDTAGRAPRDQEQLTELQRFLKLAQPQSTQLVVSATSSVAHAAQTVETFSLLSPTSLLITKLDEAVDFGSWLSLLERTSLPISYLTHGQQVPQDIMVAGARRLASLLLGHVNPAGGSLPQAQVA